MSDESASPSCISHLSIGTNDSPRTRAFYDAMMAALGYRAVFEYPGAVAYGRLYSGFRVQTLIDGRPASAGNGSHVDFFADNKVQVNALHAAVLAVGADDEGTPDPCPLYGKSYYGYFIRDLDGHRVEASYWDMNQGFDVHDHAH